VARKLVLADILIMAVTQVIVDFLQECQHGEVRVQMVLIGNSIKHKPRQNKPTKNQPIQ
jgi:hypothetical protein